MHGDWHDGNIFYQGGTVSGILDFDFAHPDLPLVDVAIAALIPEVEDSAQIAIGCFGARAPTEHELDLIATAQRARALGHVAFFIGRHVDGDHGALDQIRLGIDLLLRAEQRWPALRAAILRPHNRLTRPTFRPDMDSRYGTRASRVVKVGWAACGVVPERCYA